MNIIGSIISGIISAVLSFIFIGAIITAAETKGYAGKLTSALKVFGFLQIAFSIVSQFFSSVANTSGNGDSILIFLIIFFVLYIICVIIFTVLSLITIFKKDLRNNYGTSEKNLKIDIILCMFLGYFGVHKFYEEKIGMGILYICTFGLFGIGTYIDLIKLLIGNGSDKDGDSIRCWN